MLIVKLYTGYVFLRATCYQRKNAGPKSTAFKGKASKSTLGMSRGTYINYYAMSLCFYTYCCLIVVVITIFQTRWASKAAYAGEWSVFVWSLVSMLIHWRHMEFKDR